ncbi:MAG: branched-chain amino acid ABC transporter permease [Chloroflexi bacterium]|nr:branched-chain amino acid ABC transporter permease [Chloroflexota bacterium]
MLGIQVLNTISFSMILFLVSAGLSVAFGITRILTLAHGAIYLLGAYIGISVGRYTDNFLLSVMAGTLGAGLAGAIIVRFLAPLSTIPGSEAKRHMYQALLTFGFMLLIVDSSLAAWGGEARILPKPGILSGSVPLGDGLQYPVYRLVISVVTLAIAVICIRVYEKTYLGAMVRASVDDQEITNCIGVNVQGVMNGVLIAGSAMAGLSGAIAAPFIGAYAGLDGEILMLAFIVIVVGGLGSMRGALFAALIVGTLDVAGRIVHPALGLIAPYVIMAATLIVKPTGLLGK